MTLETRTYNGTPVNVLVECPFCGEDLRNKKVPIHLSEDCSTAKLWDKKMWKEYRKDDFGS